MIYVIGAISAIVFFALGFYSGIRCSARAVKIAVRDPEDPLAVAMTKHVDAALSEIAPEGFAVAGRQRPATWRERRRELEAKQRTKRAQREQWRG